MASGRSPLGITATDVADTSVLTVNGALDATTYVSLRDAIIEAARDEPRAVVVDVSKLVVRDESALAVFTSAQWHIAEWPNIPIGLVCNHARGQAALRRNGVTRYVPVYPTLQSATSQLLSAACRTNRQRESATLPPARSSSRECRQLIDQWLTTWSRPDFTHAVSTVATELVENALSHSDNSFLFRLEIEGSTVTVVLQHTSTEPSMQRDSIGDDVFSVDIIAATCRVWGTYTTAAGTTMWAVLGPENRF